MGGTRSLEVGIYNPGQSTECEADHRAPGPDLTAAAAAVLGDRGPGGGGVHDIWEGHYCHHCGCCGHRQQASSLK